MLPALAFSISSRDIKWGAVATLVNSIVGVSVLAMPHCFMRCGLLLGTALLILAAILTILSCNQLFSAAAACTTVGILRGSHLSLAPPSYQIVALKTLGPWAKFLSETAISSLLFGIAISYFVIIGDLSPDLTRHFFLPYLSADDAASYIPIWLNRLLILVPLTYGVALPLSMRPDFSGRTLFFVNATALTAYLLLAARIVMGALLLAPHSPLFSPSILLSVNVVHPLGLLPALSIFILSLSCQFQLLSLCTGEEPLSVVDARLAAKVAVILATILYWSIGVFGYVALLLVAATSTTSNVIPGDIFLTLNQLGFADDLLKFGFILALIAGFPLMIIPIRNCLFTMTVCCKPVMALSSMPSLTSTKVGNSASSDNLQSFQPSPFYVRYSTIILLTICLLMATAFPDMEFVLELTGATAGICVCYILPSLMYAWAMKRQVRNFGVGTDSPPHRFQQLRLYMAYFMAAFGLCIVMIAVFIPSMALRSDDEHLILPGVASSTANVPSTGSQALSGKNLKLPSEVNLQPPQIPRALVGNVE